MSAVHLRHTDKGGSGGEMDDRLALEWAARTHQPLFVAADNPASVATVRARFPGRIVIANDRFVAGSSVVAGVFADSASNSSSGAPQIAPPSPSASPRAGALPLRLTSLADAVADLWVASLSSRFMGSPGSTFSWQIEALRRARGIPELGRIDPELTVERVPLRRSRAGSFGVKEVMHRSDLQQKRAVHPLLSHALGHSAITSRPSAALRHSR
jgi:hypothetical protein